LLKLHADKGLYIQATANNFISTTTVAR